MTPEQATAGIAKVQQRLANPTPLSDSDRRQIGEFLDGVRVVLSTPPPKPEVVKVQVLPTSTFDVNIGEYALKGLAFGLGFSICLGGLAFFLGFLSVAVRM